MRILVLTSSLAPNHGYGTVSAHLCAHLARGLGATLDIFTGEKPGAWELSRNSLKSMRFESHPTLGLLMAIYDVASVLVRKRGRCDVVHVMVEHFAVAGWILSRILRVPLVITAHGTYAVRLPRAYSAFRSAFAAADQVVADSRYTRKRMEEEGVHAAYSVVNLGVDKATFVPAKSAAKRNQILFVGNAKRRKGLLFLLDALVATRDRGLATTLVVVGRQDRKDPDFTEVEDRILSLGLDVRFTGPVEERELVRLYQESKVNVLPSKSEPFFFEGFGLVHLEANACGTFTIGTLDSGNEDAISGSGGKLVRHGDVEALAGEIAEALRGDRNQEVDPAGVRDWRDVAEDYARLYRRLAAGRTVQSRAVGDMPDTTSAGRMLPGKVPA